ncbi:MAG: hypothetical protein WCL02_09900 [bacterium]
MNGLIDCRVNFFDVAFDIRYNYINNFMWIDSIINSYKREEKQPKHTKNKKNRDKRDN